MHTPRDAPLSRDNELQPCKTRYSFNKHPLELLAKEKGKSILGGKSIGDSVEQGEKHKGGRRKNDLGVSDWY